MKTTFFALAAALTLTAAVPAFAKGAGAHAGAANSLPNNFYSNTYSRPQTLAESGYADRETMSAKHPDLGAIRKEDDNSTQ